MDKRWQMIDGKKTLDSQTASVTAVTGVVPVNSAQDGVWLTVLQCTNFQAGQKRPAIPVLAMEEALTPFIGLSGSARSDRYVSTIAFIDFADWLQQHEHVFHFHLLYYTNGKSSMCLTYPITCMYAVRRYALRIVW